MIFKKNIIIHKFLTLLFLIIIIIINYLLEIIKYKKIKICLCVIGKRENLYIHEFVEHYKKLGYNKIYLYDNNDINDERFEDVIKKEIKERYIKIINYRGRNVKPQFDAYKDCYKKNNIKYDWLSFFDLDEFLELKKNISPIQKLLSNKIFKKCQNIKINWLSYISNNSLYYERRSLAQRINIPVYSYYSNKHIKSTVRGNLSINYWSNMNNPHTSLNNFTSCSISGKIINYSSPYNIPPDYTYGFLKHYFNKSFEEYCLKIQRGRSDTDKSYKIYKMELIQKLYENNKHDLKKINIMKRIFNISFIL